jgi:hypothetical protein
MSHPRLLATAMLTTVLALGCADQAPTEPSTAPTDATPAAASDNASETFSFPLTFELTPEQCPSISTTITGSGILRGVAHVSPKGNSGLFNFSFHHSFTGQATGADGSTYRASYNNQYRDSGEPEPPFVATVVDKFLLIGHGSTPDVKVHFRVTFRVNEDESVTVIDFASHGDPTECDAI